jgi:uncharacterized protein YfiM (DUF2279 family)
MRSAPVQSRASVVSLTASSGTKPGMIAVFMLLSLLSFSQDSTVTSSSNLHITSPDKKRIWLIASVNTVGYGGSLLVLSNTWYKNYAHTSFHTFNDVGEWLQVDKFGHGWTAYNTARASAAMWRWAGVSQKKSAITGSLTGVAYLTVVEYLDGHSAKWGWSWGDIGANIAGAGMFLSQELLWKEQRIQYKFSFHHKDYGDPILNQRADDLFGKVWYERMLKDYNAQTYWFSFNLRSFFKKSNLPAWLNVSAGYGADGMFGGFENTWTDKNGNPVTRRDIPRKRQFYFAPDVDFTKIRTNKKWLRTAFSFLNSFKCPAPALMFEKGRVKFFPVYF